MTDIIIAGILNCTTGEITETVTKPSEKTALRLKVRDVLNKEHGRDAFYAFELDTSLGFSLSYIKKLMKSDDTSLINPLRLLNARYKTHEAAEQFENAKAAYKLGEETYDKCCEIFKDNPKELEFIQNGLEEELGDRRDTVSRCEFDLGRYKKLTKELENLINEA
jgi:hypothetical protein